MAASCRLNAELILALLVGVCSALVFAAAAFMRVYYKGRREWAQPPGPRALPIIGHLHLLGRLPHQAFAHLSNSYGPLMSLRLGSLPVLVASSPDMAKLILHTHDKVFSGRPQNLTVTRNAFNSLDIAFCSLGPYWKLMRQLCFTEFFSVKRLAYFRCMREEEVCGLVRSIFTAQGTPIAIREVLHTVNNNIVSRMTLGERLQEHEGAASKCMPTLLALFRMMAMFNVSDYIPWLAWMDLQGLGRRSKRAARTANSMLQEVIDRRRAHHSADDPPRDFLDVLLMASLDSNHTQLHIGDEHIRAVMMDMFVGGTDTSTIAIEWALVELLTNPEKLRILRKEIDDVVGCSRLIQESDLPNLPYLRAVINETLRLHPIVPFLLPHMSLEACQISKYYIPKSTLVYVNAWAVHRDLNTWNNPLTFSPERFLDIDIDAMTQQCKFFPFGAGRRICPAWKLGLLSVQNILGNLIHAFDWKTLTEPHMNEKYGMVVSLEDPLIVVPMPKLPNNVFEPLM